MGEIFRKEISGFFSSFIGFVVIGIFILIMGLMMWVFPDFSILEYNYASLDQLFYLAPLLFLFIIPAITMRSFAEEIQNGTLETLITKPIKEYEIVLGKFFACLVLVCISLLPSIIYYYSIYQLGSPKGNIDGGQVVGSYIGLIFLSASFVSIGVYASSLSKNQVISFLLSIFLCFIFYYAFQFLSKLPIFFGKVDDIVLKIGIDDHYRNISKGAIDSRDVLYFISVIGFFIWLTIDNLKDRKF